MSAPIPAPVRPGVTSIEEAIARMETIDAGLPATDGLACFNRMYLEVTREVSERLKAGFFADPEFMTTLDVAFANLYFAAADIAAEPGLVPLAWRPLIEQREHPGIEPVQFALAGMNAHINHDLPIAVVQTCAGLGTAPADGTHQADYQKVDRLLDAIEQSVRQSFESPAERAADHHVAAVGNLIASWTINSARDLAWTNSLLFWQIKDDQAGYELLGDSLAVSTALASRLLLVAV
jgi:hypothetical protein